MDLYIGQGFGLEEIQYLLWDTLTENLNNEIAVQELSKAQLDEAIADKKNVAYDPVVVNRIDITNFHVGSKPSLLEGKAGPDSYPAVSVVADDSRPSNYDSADQGSMYTDGVYVDIIVRASESEGEGVCNARIYRTTDAVNNVLMVDPTFGGAFAGLGSPALYISPIFRASANNEGHGELALYQISRIEYSLDKFSPFDV